MNGFSIAPAFARGPNLRDDGGVVLVEDAPSSPFRAGYRLGRYELLCPLAEGGMAIVWIARMEGTRGRGHGEALCTPTLHAYRVVEIVMLYVKVA